MSQVIANGIETAYREKFPTSAKMFAEARNIFPNGVTHDGRFLLPFPVYIDRLTRQRYDFDGNEITDYWMGHGSLLLGHSHPAVVEAVQRQVAKGTAFRGLS